MSSDLAIEVRGLRYRYGRAEAVHDLDLRVEPGRCYGFFGRNGAGKTTTIRCLLDLLRPAAGSIRIFGEDPVADEVAVKSRVAYVPDHVAFYPWMRVADVLDYLASFRPRWNAGLERELLDQFRLDEGKQVDALSKGQKTQLALVGAIAGAPDLLILDEPTAGLDPIVRRQLIETVIGAYQDADPGRRTVFLSTHLIGEFEGLIDEFTILDGGRAVLAMGADDARARHRRIRARFASPPPEIDLPGVLQARRRGRELELVVNGPPEPILERLRGWAPEAITAEGLTLEEIFVASVQAGEAP